MNTTKSPHADSSITSATATAAREAYDAALTQYRAAHAAYRTAALTQCRDAYDAGAREAYDAALAHAAHAAIAALASARAVHAECKSALDAAVHARSAEAYAELFADDADLTLPRCKV